MTETQVAPAPKKKALVAQPISWIKEYFEQFETSLNGQSKLPLHAIRKEALARCEANGIPHPRLNEAWKYTNLRNIASMAPAIQKASGSVVPGESLLLESPIARLWFENGQFCTEKSDLDRLPEGVTISRLTEVSSDSGHPLSAAVTEAISSSGSEEAHESLVADVNTAFLTDGVVVSVKAGVECESPVEVLWVAEGATGEAYATQFPFVFVQAEEGARIALVETFVGTGNVLTAGATHLKGEKGAELVHVKVQAESRDTTHLHSIFTTVGEEATVQTAVVNTGGKQVRNEVYPTIQGGSSMAGLFGVTILDGSQHVDNHTVIDHAVPEAESLELYKGVYDAKSNGVFNGTIIVRPDAQQTNAIQSNNSLLLSDTAKSVSRPQLKIWADDVKCTHGATIGQLDEDSLFYLRSRGIGKERARAILIHAFAAEAVEELACPVLKLHIENLVHEKLNMLVEAAHVPSSE